MVVTIVAILMIMVGYFLILYSAVALIQEKRFYTSAPEEVQAVIPEREGRIELFPGARKVGWAVFAFAMVLFCAAFVLAIRDSVRNDYPFLQSLMRFLVILYAMELYDIGLFDWVLLCHSNFYPRYCPECKDVVGPHLFWFNGREHIRHFLLYIPASIVLALLCTGISMLR